MNLKTRREFLRSTVLGSSLVWTVPAFLAETFERLHAESVDKATQVGTGKDDTIFVLLQMAGGNDGLNTVVPFSNDHYQKARPTLGLRENRIIKLNDQFGLHPSLTGFQQLFNDGLLADDHLRNLSPHLSVNIPELINRCYIIGITLNIGHKILAGARRT